MPLVWSRVLGDDHTTAGAEFLVTITLQLKSGLFKLDGTSNQLDLKTSNERQFTAANSIT